jgi:hypothetical protein
MGGASFELSGLRSSSGKEVAKAGVKERSVKRRTYPAPDRKAPKEVRVAAPGYSDEQPIYELPLRSVYEELRGETEEWSRPLEEEKNRPMIWGLEL